MKSKITTIIYLVLFSSIFTFGQNKLSLGIDAGIASPSGDFGDIYESGFGARISGHYPLSKSFNLFASAGYYTWSFKEDYFEESNPGSNVDASLANIPLVAGFNYFILNGKFRPYLTIEVGLHLLSFDQPTVSEGIEVTYSDLSESVGGWGIGAGFLYELSPKLSLDVLAKFNGNSNEFSQTRTESGFGFFSEETTSSTMTYLTISGGVRISL